MRFPSLYDWLGRNACKTVDKCYFTILKTMKKAYNNIKMKGGSKNNLINVNGFEFKLVIYKIVYIISWLIVIMYIIYFIKYYILECDWISFAETKKKSDDEYTFKDFLREPLLGFFVFIIVEIIMEHWHIKERK